MFWSAAGLAVVLVWALAIRVPPTSYNLSQFTPLVLLGLLLMAATLPRPGRLLSLAVAAGLASSVALLKQGTEVVAAPAQDRTYDAARNEVRGLLPTAGCVLVDPRSPPSVSRHYRLKTAMLTVPLEERKPLRPAGQVAGDRRAAAGHSASCADAVALPLPAGWRLIVAGQSERTKIALY